MDVSTMLIPMVVLLVPAFIMWQISKNKEGFLGGAVLGIIIGYSSGIIGAWGILVAVLGVASLFVQERI
ncbi:MAG: hypothetical protein EOM68_31820 [Spirochaetia bacterium]|nr:hypothetical protein [Spirochaetia bacterium]